MTSNLPPGVTGREDAFGPQAEVVMSRACGNVEWHPMLLTNDAADWVQHVVNVVARGADMDRIAANVTKMNAAIEGCPKSQESHHECGFDGDVDVQVWSGGITWTCPWCGYEHDDDADGIWEPDPDDARDRDLDAVADQ